MLHISQEDKLRIIKDRINQYNIRFPVATLNKETGEDQGNISKMLKGKKTITDKFFTSIMEKYPEKTNGKKIDKDEGKSKLKSEGVDVTLQEYIDELRSDKKSLQNTIDSNLTALMTLLAALSRHDRSFHETILKSLSRLEGGKVDLVLEARSSEAAMQVQEFLAGSKKEADT